MIIKKRTIPILFIILTLVISTKLQLVEGKIYADPEDDVLFVVDGVYQEHTSIRGDLDIISLEITISNIYLTLKDDLYSRDHRRYSVEIYWDDVVEERGYNVGKNQTRCLYDYDDDYTESFSYDSEGELTGSYSIHHSSVSGNRITWDFNN
ncbi:MAG: hypothetical protein ACTSQN_16425, partial [Candidatus Heimdallarchaeota archaeon]